MFTKKKIALVSVINDLVTDNRVNRTCMTLHELGFEVLLIGRKLNHSLPLPAWPFKAKRMRLLFTKGPLFYLFFNLRLFYVLMTRKSTLLYANDLDTLPANYLVSRIKKIPLIYDSHELFCEVPELAYTPLKRNIWRWLEKKMLPGLKHCITVNESIAAIFSKQYAVHFENVKNIAPAPENFKPKFKEALGLPADREIIVLQGAGINVDRGAEELIEAMTMVDKALLLVIGSGDVWPVLERMVKEKRLNEKVRLIKKLPRPEMLHFTHNASLGVSIDKDTNLNYHNSLPNKIFDYLQAGVPVMASRLPEVEKIISRYAAGDFIESHKPADIARKINGMLEPANAQRYRAGALEAAREMNWETEKNKLVNVILKAADGPG